MKVFIIAALIALVAADGYNKAEEYSNVQVPHSFAWEVKDAETYNDYAHNHNNDGKGTTGSYRVVLPDGRTQIVSYTSDSYRGYEVDVQYQGEAKYDDNQSVYQVAKPVYQVVQPVYQVVQPVYQTPRPVYQTPRPVYQTPRPVYKPVQYTTTPKAVEYTTTTTTQAPTTQAAYSTYQPKKHQIWYFNTNKN